MTTYQIEKRTREGILAGLGLATLWIIAAAVRPTSTFHLAPILIAGIVPFLGTKAGLQDRAVAIAALVGLAMAAASSVVLSLFGLLRGPSLLPFGNAFAETIMFAAATTIVTVALSAIMPSAEGETA